MTTTAPARAGLWRDPGFRLLGALLSAQIGATSGVRPAVLAAGTGTLFAFLWALCPPIRGLRVQPQAADERAFAP